MEIVKRFFHGTPLDTIEQSIMIPQGQLYLIRTPNSPKSESECLSNDDIVLSLKNGQLVVWKSEIEDDDDEEDEENEEEGEFAETSILETFDLKQNSLICLFERNKKRIITWRDPQGDFGDMYEYRISSDVPYSVIDQFMLAVYKCLYENKYHKSSENVELEQLQEFVIKRSDIELYVVPDSIESDDETPALVPEVELNNEDDDNDDDDDDDDEDLFFDADDQLESRVGTGSNLNQMPCQLFVFSNLKSTFKLANANSEIIILKLEGWNYFLEIINKDNSEVLVQTTISENINPTFEIESFSFIFNQIVPKTVHTWKVAFVQQSHFQSFQDVFVKCLWESKNCREYPDDDYLSRTMGDIKLSTTEGEEDETDDDDDDNNNNNNDDDNESEQNSKSKMNYNIGMKYSDEENEMNSGLKVGLVTDRAFVSRGDKLGIFKTDEELEFATSINNISSNKYSRINPDQMMLMNSDSVMVIQDKSKLNVLHSLDLEKGKVVQDWEMSKDGLNKDIKVFTTNSKYSGINKEDSFLGATSQALFRVDQRMKNGFISSDEFKEYKTGLGITAITTTIDGLIAIAARDGSIKLYDKLGKNAKTALPPLGDEIYALDVTLNGRYLIATCRTYLLLIDLQIKEGKFKGELGFSRSFPIDSKPEPTRLRLQPGHMATLMKIYGNDIKFTPAKFDNLSKTIISSMGKYSFIWDMKNAIKGKKYPIKIRAYGDNIVMGDFAKHVDQVLVTMKNDVALTSRSAFNNPKDAFNSKNATI